MGVCFDYLSLHEGLLFGERTKDLLRTIQAEELEKLARQNTAENKRCCHYSKERRS